MYLILCYLFLPHQEIRISLNAIDALQPLHLAIYWGIITLSLTFSLDNKSNGTHQEPPLSTGFQFSSVARLCSTLCSPVDHSMPGLPVHHQLLELTDPCPLTQWCHPTISSSVVSFSSCLQSFPASGSFQMSQLFVSGDQSIEASASTSVLLMNIQNWFPLGWTG